REFKKLANGAENGLTYDQLETLMDKSGFDYYKGTLPKDGIDGLEKGYVPIIFYNDRESGNAHANILRRYETYIRDGTKHHIFNVLDPLPAPQRYSGLENFRNNFHFRTYIIRGYKP